MTAVAVAVFEVFTQMIGIEGLVGPHGIKLQAVNQIRHPDNLTALAWERLEANEVAQGVGERQNLCGQSAF